MSEFWLKVLVALLVIGFVVSTFNHVAKTARINILEQRVTELEQQVRR